MEWGGRRDRFELRMNYTHKDGIRVPGLSRESWRKVKRIVRHQQPNRFRDGSQINETVDKDPHMETTCGAPYVFLEDPKSCWTTIHSQFEEDGQRSRCETDVLGTRAAKRAKAGWVLWERCRGRCG